MIEIERKFLVNDTDFLKDLKGQAIKQGYLSIDPERTIRIRVKGEEGFITIKGLSSNNGLSRYEWEKSINVMEVEELLCLALPSIIDKTRYEIHIEKHLWEVDLFHRDNEGLVIAEVELSSKDESFELPDWCGEEVTGDERYYNAYLSSKPYTLW